MSTKATRKAVAKQHKELHLEVFQMCPGESSSIFMRRFHLQVVLPHPSPCDNYTQNIYPNLSSQCSRAKPFSLCLQDAWKMLQSGSPLPISYKSESASDFQILIFQKSVEVTMLNTVVNLACMNFKAILNFFNEVEEIKRKEFSLMWVLCSGQHWDTKRLSTDFCRRLHTLSVVSTYLLCTYSLCILAVFRNWYWSNIFDFF